MKKYIKIYKLSILFHITKHMFSVQWYWDDGLRPEQLAQALMDSHVYGQGITRIDPKEFYKGL